MTSTAEIIPDQSDIPAATPKRMLSYQLEREMARQKITRVAMAEKMKTSRMQLNRLLDPENPSTTLQSIESAAHVLGMRVIITLQSDEKDTRS